MLESRDFINQALVITCLSLLLEAFGHVYLSLTSGFGYLIYILQPKFILFMIWCAGWSDGGGLFAGSAYGKTQFAASISPNKTMEGVLGAIIFP